MACGPHPRPPSTTPSTSVYKRDGWGLVYTNLRVPYTVLVRYLAHDINFAEFLAEVDVKVGHTSSYRTRRRAYRKCERGIAIVWGCAFVARQRILAENITHRILRAMGVEPLIYPCPGCAVRHHEYFPLLQVGGLVGMERVILAAIRATGQTRVDKIVFDESGRQIRKFRVS
ncbi:hypothetical protein DFH07DRAFT_951482 [Mycena maculata]|uniref:Uncharacterized protein n=1 Tax=Mycena maculata TaxID=230809 RepID=A0AAD7NVP6_9AGAR|nr:hypothetical protein DFH07DRAFT_951482 [Mycena maculata]